MPSPESVVVPVAIRHALPDVDVDVDGARLALMIDTGAFAGISLHPSAAARTPGLRFTGSTRRFSDARGNVHVARRFVAREIAIGAFRVRDVEGQELVFDEDFAPPNRTGYVGRDLLSRRRLLFDDDAGTLALLAGAPRGDELALRAREPIPMDESDVGLTVEALVDGRPARFVIDSGSTHSVRRAARGDGRASVHRVVLGGVALAIELVDVDAGPPGVDGILGRSFFERRRVLLDIPGRKLWFS